jgi:hypothetical protein
MARDIGVDDNLPPWNEKPTDRETLIAIKDYCAKVVTHHLERGTGNYYPILDRRMNEIIRMADRALANG